MKLRSAVAMTFALLLVGTLIHQANAWIQKDVTIGSNDQISAIDCNGSTVSVRGDDNKLTIKGECNKLTVSGDDNVITATSVKELEVSGSDNNITVDVVGKISATGDDNHIKWTKGLAGKAPEISVKGKDNTINKP